MEKARDKNPETLLIFSYNLTEWGIVYETWVIVPIVLVKQKIVKCN